MTIRNLLNLILKIIGILFIRDMLLMLPQLSLSFVMFEQSAFFEKGIMNFVLSASMILVYVLVARLFIFKSESVIDFLRLDHDFEEEKLEISMHRSAILSITIIIIGGLMVAEGIPKLCLSIYEYNISKYYSYGQTHFNNAKLYASIATISVGVLLMTLQQRIVNLIELKRIRNIEEEEE
jgi:hypothetical protein